MAKCFITGVDLPAHEAYVLDIAAANKAARKLRQQLQALERLMEQLAPRDDVEVFNRALMKKVILREKRLVTQTIADAWADICPESEIFISFVAWKQKRLAYTKWTPRREGDNASNIFPETI